MKAIAAGAALFGTAMGGLIHVNSDGSQYSWIIAGMLYVLALFLVQFLQPMTTDSLHACVRFNMLTAAMVTLLIFIDTLILHRGVFKDIEPLGGGFRYRVVAVVLGVGMPTAIVRSLFGLSIARVLRDFRTK
jgi:hypothetical protein